MEKEPLLPTINPNAKRRRSLLLLSTSPASPFLSPLPEDDEVLDPPLTPFSPSAAATPTSTSFKDYLIFGNPFALSPPSSPPPSPDGHPPPQVPPPPPPPPPPASFFASPSVFADDPPPWLTDPSSHPKAKTNLHRSRTAPAMSAINEIVGPAESPAFSPSSSSSAAVFRQAAVFLLLYLAFGIAVYTFGRHQFESDETHPVVDALYFSIVTMCTIGYGDITPRTALAKLFSVAFVLVGFGFIDILLSGTVSYFLDLQEALLLSTIKAEKRAVVAGNDVRHKRDARSYIFDVKKGRMRIRLKVGLALGVVVLCVGVGTTVLHFVERLGLLDSFYLAVMSVTTVGYGDHAFKTMAGRLFASFWLLFSTLAVARAFLYLAEARIDKRHRMIAKRILGRDMTVAEFLAADIDNNGFVTKSEFVIYKLKEMGKISDKDIALICNQFEKLDIGNCGKITLTDLIESHHHC